VKVVDEKMKQDFYNDQPPMTSVVQKESTPVEKEAEETKGKESQTTKR
jgi:hypothetical protein